MTRQGIAKYPAGGNICDPWGVSAGGNLLIKQFVTHQGIEP